MASAVIHLCIAKKVNNYIQKNERELSLGAIAPDIAKLVGESKNRSHFLEEDDSEVKQNTKYKAYDFDEVIVNMNKNLYFEYEIISNDLPKK